MPTAADTLTVGAGASISSNGAITGTLTSITFTGGGSNSFHSAGFAANLKALSVSSGTTTITMTSAYA